MMSAALIFVIGLCVGSFLNVVADRIPAGQTIIRGRSHCDFCKKTLAWYDLLPILSYVFLFGKCRYCHKKLSLQYPLVEVLTGVSFGLLFFLELPLTYEGILLFVIDAAIIACGITLTVMDAKYHLLADAIVFPLLFLIFARILILNPSMLPFHLFVGVIAAMPLLFLFLFSRGKAMGLGDVKLVLVLGVLLSWEQVIIMYYVAFLTGAMTGVILILEKKKKFFGSTIAFGPFLLFGAVCAALFGGILWTYLRSLLGF